MDENILAVIAAVSPAVLGIILFTFAYIFAILYEEGCRHETEANYGPTNTGT